MQVSSTLMSEYLNIDFLSETLMVFNLSDPERKVLPECEMNFSLDVFFIF